MQGLLHGFISEHRVKCTKLVYEKRRQRTTVICTFVDCESWRAYGRRTLTTMTTKAQRHNDTARLHHVK